MHPAVRPLLVLASSVALALTGTALTAGPASASTTYTLNSRDDGGRATVTVTWYSASRYAASWSNCDIRADSRGPILSLSQMSQIGELHTNVYDHDLTGKNSCDTSYVSVNNGLETLKLVIQECNGGSRYAPENCDADFIKNPLDV